MGDMGDLCLFAPNLTVTKEKNKRKRIWVLSPLTYQMLEGWECVVLVYFALSHPCV